MASIVGSGSAFVSSWSRHGGAAVNGRLGNSRRMRPRSLGMNQAQTSDTILNVKQDRPSGPATTGPFLLPASCRRLRRATRAARYWRANHHDFDSNAAPSQREVQQTARCRIKASFSLLPCVPQHAWRQPVPPAPWPARHAPAETGLPSASRHPFAPALFPAGS